MSDANGITVNGLFGKVLAVFVSGLLLAGVVGIWKMSLDFGRLDERVLQIDRSVQANTARLGEIERAVRGYGP